VYNIEREGLIPVPCTLDDLALRSPFSPSFRWGSPWGGGRVCVGLRERVLVLSVSVLVVVCVWWCTYVCECV
jgi:hypothetical protein